jgi:cytochrome b subunit of formate dehydrogenase/bacterioferritin-associated ferredoxin
MNSLTKWLLAGLASVIAPALAGYAEEQPVENQCVLCHGASDIWEGDTLHLFVSPEAIKNDVHWQKGLGCTDCHGGDPNTTEVRIAHATDNGFRKIASPADLLAACGRCHSDAKVMEKYKSKLSTDHAAKFPASVHGETLKLPAEAKDKIVTCSSCHPKHGIMSAKDPASGTHPSQMGEMCGQCHRQPLVDLRKSVHQKAGVKTERGTGALLDCLKCHGADVHGMKKVKDATSPVFLDHQVETCGGCHTEYLATYNRSVHGHGLRESGLTMAAVCSDCHGSHGVYYAADLRSTLNMGGVAKTCGKCHHFIEERLKQSVHGSEGGPGTIGKHAAPGGKTQRTPTCTDCHQGHDPQQPDSEAFRVSLANRCGNCHPDLSQRYRMSLHGQLTEIGYEPAATCHNCHGAHDIVAVKSARSPVAGPKRTETCRQCHPGATANFAQFDPHADEHDAKAFPWLYFPTAISGTLLAIGVGLFALHAVVWFARSFNYTQRHGRDRRLKPGMPAMIRIAPRERLVYYLLLISFIGLASTGLPLKFSNYSWAQRTTAFLGGFSSMSLWHHTFAVVLLWACGFHVVGLIQKLVANRSSEVSLWKRLFGPDSPLFGMRDVRDIGNMFRWFIGLGNRPKFESWTYWEKLDYWAVWVGVTCIATSGLMLWFPNVFSLVLPGQALNVAKTFHAEVALSLGGFVLLIHVFNSHMRPEKFPMDASLFTGLSSEAHMRFARPEYLNRLSREGKLDALLTTTPSRERLWPQLLFGLAVILVALLLLVAILLAVLSK